jgi:hypothetical protein
MQAHCTSILSLILLTRNDNSSLSRSCPTKLSRRGNLGYWTHVNTLVTTHFK